MKVRLRGKPRIIVATAIGLAGLGVGTLHQPSHAATCIPRATLAAPEWDLTYWINTTRLQHGLPAIPIDSRLESVARSWVVAMGESGQIAHNPNLATQAPPDWRYLGENVGSGSSLEAVNNGFMGSAEHYSNIVDANYDAMGVAAVNVGGVVYVVEDFEYSASATNQCP